MANIKRLIAFILTIAMFAVMTTTAFAGNCIPFPRSYYLPTTTQSALIGYYSTQWLVATNFVDSAGVPERTVANTENAAQFIYHATHDCGLECCSYAADFIPGMEIGDETQHYKNVVKYADALKAEFGTELTRAELAVVIYRAAIENGFTGNPNVTHIDLPDINTVDSETATAIQFVMDNGLMLWTRGDVLQGQPGQGRNDYAYLSDAGFQPNTIANFGDIVGSAMFLHYAVNDASGFNARTMDYSYDNVHAVFATVHQAASGGAEKATNAYYANMDAYKTK